MFSIFCHLLSDITSDKEKDKDKHKEKDKDKCKSSASVRTNFKLVLPQAAYKAVVQASNQIFNQKLWYIMVNIQPHLNLPNKFANLCCNGLRPQLEQYLMKYGWAGSGMVMIAIPILTSKAESDRAGESGVSTF